jgi:hypothetical protein
MGFEVINTTAIINKQGLVTSYRVPNQNRLTSTQVIAGDWIISAAPPPRGVYDLLWPMLSMFSGGPPGTIAEAVSYAGTTQWQASEGSYTVCAFDTAANTLAAGGLNYRSFVNNDVFQLAASAAPTNPTGVGTATSTYTFIGNVITSAPSFWSQPIPFDISGVMYTGLSPSTTLTVNVRYYVEIAPHRYDPNFGQLVFSATESAAFDRQALDTYNTIVRSMPAAVPHSMNPGGEWWDKIAAAIKSVLPVAVNAITGAATPMGLLAQGLSVLPEIATALTSTSTGPRRQPRVKTDLVPKPQQRQQRRRVRVRTTKSRPTSQRPKARRSLSAASS